MGKQSGASNRKRKRLEYDQTKKDAANAKLFFEPFKKKSSFENVISTADTNDISVSNRLAASPKTVASDIHQLQLTANVLPSSIIHSPKALQSTSSKTVVSPSGKFIEENQCQAVAVLEPVNTFDCNASSNNWEVEDSIEGSLAEDTDNLLAHMIKYQDIGLLPFDDSTGRVLMTDEIRDVIISKGLKYFQNQNGPFAEYQNRSMTKTWFKRKLVKSSTNAIQVERSWLAYSPSTKSAFCICCMLFPDNSRSVSCQSSLEKKNWI